jgi:hypothetical protein
MRSRLEGPIEKIDSSNNLVKSKSEVEMGATKGPKASSAAFQVVFAILIVLELMRKDMCSL